jgi:DNA primase
VLLVRPWGQARPLPGPPVATPLEWDELNSGLDPGAFTPAVVLERVAERVGG